jgi:glycosyltransferase involved in cell wall biosynthesis
MLNGQWFRLASKPEVLGASDGVLDAPFVRNLRPGVSGDLPILIGESGRVGATLGWQASAIWIAEANRECVWLGQTSQQMKASVVIATKNRKDALRRAIRSAVEQTEPVEVLVLDDGSTDGTADMVRSEFPQIRLDQTAVSVGYIIQRNRGALLSSCDIIFSIDDDAEFSTPSIVEQTLPGFSHPRVGAIAIPYVEPHKSPQQFQTAPNADAIWITDSFRGTAHALRRDVFIKLGGYRQQFVHQGEEMDFCIRLINSGLLVRLGVGDTIAHYEFPKRDWSRMDFYGRRNDILFALKNVPMPYLPVHLLGTTFNGMICAVRTKRPSAMMRGMLSGYSDVFTRWRCEPVSQNAYLLYRLLKKRGPKMLAEIEQLLPQVVLPDHVCTEHKWAA